MGVCPTTTDTTERERLSQLLSQLPMPRLTPRLTPGCTTTGSATLGSTRTAMDITVWVTPMPATATIPTLTVVMDAGTDTELWSPVLADNLHVQLLFYSIKL